MKKITFVLCALALACAACGGGNIDPEDAQKGWGSANQVMTQGSAQAQSQPADALNINYDFPCPEGGSAIFVGNLDTGDGFGSGISFDFVVTYDACTADGTTMDGEMTYVSTMESSENGVSTTLEWNGDIDFSGEVKGNCVIDMTGATSSTFSDMTFDVSVEYSGTICGHDASQTLNQSSGDV